MTAAHRRLAKNIRARAKERGILVTHLTDHAGLGRSSLFAVMAGKQSPTLGWLEELARALDCDVVDLLAK